MAKEITIMSPIANPFLAWGALIFAVVGPVLTWLVASRKVQIEESASVFDKWKALTERMESMAESHAREMKDLRDELRTEREENQSLRTRVRTLEDRLAEAERERRAERTGFVRQISHLQRTLQAHGILTTVPPIGEPPEEGNRTSEDILRELDEDDGA